MFWRRNDRSSRRQDVLDRVVAACQQDRQSILDAAVAAGEIPGDDVAELLRLAARLESLETMTPSGWAARDASQHAAGPAEPPLNGEWEYEEGELIGIAVGPGFESEEDAGGLIGIEIVADGDDAGPMLEPAGVVPGAPSHPERPIDFAARIRARRRAALIANAAARSAASR